jgi:toxin FitB
VAAGYLLDTNIISETRKAQANNGVIAFLSVADAKQLFMSVLWLGELRKGVEAKRRSDPVAADRLGEWVDSIESTFSDHLLPIDVPVAQRCGELSAAWSLLAIDTLIAATAISHDLTLVTRNTRDVAATGVLLLDPWRAG